MTTHQGTGFDHKVIHRQLAAIPGGQGIVQLSSQLHEIVHAAVYCQVVVGNGLQHKEYQILAEMCRGAIGVDKRQWQTIEPLCKASSWLVGFQTVPGSVHVQYEE